MMALVYVRIATASVIIAIQVVPTPKVHACKDGGSIKLDSIPAGGLRAGVSYGIGSVAMMASSLNAEEKLWLRTQS